MKSRALTFVLVLFPCAWPIFAQQPPPPPREPGELLSALNRVLPDPTACYKLETGNRIELRRGDAKLLFEGGELAFLAPVDGKTTGAVFSGRGHILATPRDPVEKQQYAYFLNAPVLDQDFTSAYMRFSVETADELFHQLQSAHVTAQTDQPFVALWESAVLPRNPAHSLRLLYESLSPIPHAYFAAGLGGVQTGPFDFIYDEARDEPEMLGQAKKVNNLDFYDIWSSSRPPGSTPVPRAFRALQYKIDATIHPDNSLSGEVTVHMRAESSGERLLGFEFSRFLTVELATLAGAPLFTYPNDATTSEERKARGTDALFVVLPQAPKKGELFDLTFRYHGNVIRDAGNGVLFVTARESWYPHFGYTDEFSDYDLTLHWPHKLRLAATGTKVSEREEGDQRTGHWHTEKPATVAGFNLGEYAFASLTSSSHSVDVYANRQLEQALLNRLRVSDIDAVPAGSRPFGAVSAERLHLPLTEPSPADALKQLARDIDSSIRFYETYSGPFPVKQLSVSQIPGTFGQGWPGLLYLSTFSFLPASAQERVGLSTSGQEHFHDLVPFHEVAHQWWGNVVGWSSYRDQWIDEALSNYLSLLFADSQRSPDHKLRVWLDRYRKRLLEKGSAETAPADIGGLTLGSRLDSSRSPEGFDELVYGKGAWIFHMIREMLREPKSKNPDARFMEFLQGLQEKYAYRALSTQDLQKELEAVMTPAMGLESRHSMEWFFADWVRGAGIPHYKIEFTAKPSDKGFLVKGKLLQSGVPESFVAPVPVYSSGGEYLGRIIASGPETSFRFVTQHSAGKLVIDPQMTLLCVTER
jgi:Peptidase family M1 domain